MKIATIAQDSQCLDAIQRYLAQSHATHTLVSSMGGIQQVPAVIEQEHPDLLLLEGAGLSSSELQVIDRATSRFPELGIIMLCPAQSQEYLIEAMRAGVREIVPTPVTQHVLVDAVDRFQKRRQQAKTAIRKGKILAFIPCKGGSGSTFLASNIAYALAASEQKKSALIDFNLQFGDASLFVQDSVPKTTIADVTRQIERLDGSFLSASMVQVLPNFEVLSAPEEPEMAAEIKPEHVKPLLQVAVKQYEFVVLDIGRSLDAVSIQALDQADYIFPVVQQTLPSIRDAKRMINTFHALGYVNDKIRLIVNRYEKKNDITLGDITDTLKLPIFKTVPNDYDVVAESVNQGIPVTRLAPRSVVARSIQDIARELSGVNQEKRSLRKLFAF
ncbi:AAA family ATPase [Nitrosomonas sp. ANs5]|uniref:AAA family ATPase n=1 Tax=Nitrosomonas sp. ANs5 TaxID=3423941 RepID=UPI003D338A63